MGFERIRSLVGGAPASRSDPGRPFAITPDDDAELEYHARAVRVGTTAGDVAVLLDTGATVVIPNVQVGETVNTYLAVRVLATGTTAVGITGFA